MRHITFILSFIFLFCPNIFSQNVSTIGNIPNPKMVSNDHYVSNPNNILSNETVQSLDTILYHLEKTTTVQIAVVIVQSIGDAIPKDFAYTLFNTWGIGQKENDNGLLIFLVIDARRMEFETGYGLEGILPDGLVKRIQLEKMVPRAKEGNYDAAVYDGVLETVKIISNPSYKDEVYAASSYGNDSVEEEKPLLRSPAGIALLSILGGIYLIFTIGAYKYNEHKLQKKPDYIKNQLTPNYLRTKYFLLNILIPLAITLHQSLSGNFRFGEFMLMAYGVTILLLLEKRIRNDRFIALDLKNASAHKSYIQFSNSYSGWIAAAFFFPLPFIYISINHYLRQKKLRNTSPFENTKGEIIKLDEQNDDAYLEAFQLKEEQIKSVDYDVWLNKSDQKHMVLRYPNRFTKYVYCTNCKAIASFVSKKHTLSAPSYSSSGTGEKIYLCKNCNHTHSVTFVIPKLTTSSSSSSGSSHSGGGGGGGGFGGGGSGGGGAGSSW